MLQPKRLKHRKMHKRTHGGLGGIAARGNTIAFGEFAIRTLEPGWITARQLEAARRDKSHGEGGPREWRRGSRNLVKRRPVGAATRQLIRPPTPRSGWANCKKRC